MPARLRIIGNYASPYVRKVLVCLELNDSSVICQYPEDRCPAPALYPVDIAERAQARWLEESADTRLAGVLIWRLFYQCGARPRIFGENTDQAIVQHARVVAIPAALD